LPRTCLAIRARVELFSAPLSVASKRLVENPNFAALVCDHLVLLHQITRASVPLMRAAVEVARAAAEDPVCKVLRPYLENHIEEELYHDEWTLDDLSTIGVNRNDVLSRAPAANVASLVGAQYYWIYHYHPVALMGYMIMLESNAPSVQFVREMIERTGLPAELFRTRMLHAELDPGHQEDLFDLIESLPLSRDQEKLISRSISHTSAMLADCFAKPQLWNGRC
jgi:hypothetical protein